MDRVRSTASFPDARSKTRYLDGAAREDAQRHAIAALGARFRPLPPAARADAIFRFVRWAVAFREDLAGEEFDSPELTLERGEDDCDGSARLLVAIALAAGLEARIRGVLSPDGAVLEHVQAELRWPDSESHPLADADGWVLAETTLAGVELGQGAESGIVDAAGSFAVLGAP